MSIQKEIGAAVSKSTIANIVAAVVVLLGLLAGVGVIPGYQESGFLVNLVFAAAGYLFGAQVAKAKQT